MTATLELPNGDVVTPDDVFLYNGYPYRYVPRTDGFLLRPLYWGDSDMDIPFRDREALLDQWEPSARGTLTAAEWEAWLRDAAADDRFGDEEVRALASELPVTTDPIDSGGLVSRVRDALGL